MFFLLTLPFRIVFGLLFLLCSVRRSCSSRSCCCGSSIKAVVLAGGAAVRAAGRSAPRCWWRSSRSLCVLMIPLLPFAFVALCIWAVVRSTRPALTANF